MSILSRLFGGGASKPEKPQAKPEVYKGFAITPTPIREGSHFRVSARIDKEVGGEMRSHTLVRADVLESAEAAAQTSVRKAQQMIDEQGERLFS